MTTDILQSLDSQVQQHLPGVIDFLADLVRIPGPRGQESAALDRVAQELQTLGMSLHKVPLRLDLESTPSSLDLSQSYNWVGVLPGTGGGRSLALNFHLDTAPIGPEELWSTPPLSGLLQDGKLYGRGAWDDKAGAALALLVLRTLKSAGVQLKGDLLVQAVVEDETTGLGTLAVVEAGYGADGAIVLDGAYGATAILAHPGHTTFRITLYGKPAPSCRADLGVNAIEKMFPILERLRQLEEEMNANLPDDWSSVVRPISFNPGTITGGSWTGAVAEKCSLDAQMAFLPPYTLDSFRQHLVQEILNVAQQDPWFRDNPPQIEFLDLATEPVELNPDSEFLKILSGACEEVFQAPLTPRKVTGWCDLRHFQRKQATPCCLFGPGRGSNAHRPDEYFEVDQLEPHARVVLRHILQWCNA